MKWNTSRWGAQKERGATGRVWQPWRTTSCKPTEEGPVGQRVSHGGVSPWLRHFWTEHDVNVQMCTQCDYLPWTWKCYAGLARMWQQKNAQLQHKKEIQQWLRWQGNMLAWVCFSHSATKRLHFHSVSVLCSFLSSSLWNPRWRPQHVLRVPRHQPFHSYEVRGATEVLTPPQNQSQDKTYWYVPE